MLRLEADPNDTAVLEDLFRSAHSLKGAARMLGVTELETLAHHFEDELGAARRGRQPITSASADRLYHGLDAMRRLAQEACTGEAPPVDPPESLVFTDEEEAQGTEPFEYLDVVQPAVVTLPRPETPIGLPENEVAPSTSATFKIETIRVEPQKLDSLTTLAGEMVVTTARTLRAFGVVGDLAELWEEWNREANSWHRALGNASQDPLKQLAQFQDRETARLKRVRVLLDRLERARDEEVGRLGLVADEIIDAIHDIRLLPFSTIFNLFPRLVRDLSHELGKEVRLEIEGGGVTADKHLLEELKDPLMHMIRNAVDHAIELPDERERLGKPREATIHLRAYRSGGRMVIEVADDGRGLDEMAIRHTALSKHLLPAKEIAALPADEVWKLIFFPGFSTAPLVTDVSGRGVGLDVVRTNIDRLKGSIAVHSESGVGCTFRIDAPITLATTRVLLVQLGERSYALPIESVQETFIIPPESLFTLAGRPAIQWAGGPVTVTPLSGLLELPGKPTAPREGKMPGVLLNVGSERLGLFVDALLDEQEVILKPFGGLLERVRNVLGSTILSSGEICMILNPSDLIKTMRTHRTVGIAPEPKVEARKKVVLLVEDSITTRTQEKRILEAAGYEVVTAVDGADGFTKLATRDFDVVVTDVEMPNMTGLQLAARIREDAKYVELPIILVTSLASDADRQRGVEVGANAYLTKGNFEQKLLLETLKRLA